MNTWHPTSSEHSKHARFFLFLLACQIALVFAWGFWEHTSRHPDVPLFAINHLGAPNDRVVEKPAEKNDFDALIHKYEQRDKLLALHKSNADLIEKCFEDILECKAGRERQEKNRDEASSDLGRQNAEAGIKEWERLLAESDAQIEGCIAVEKRLKAMLEAVEFEISQMEVRK